MKTSSTILTMAFLVLSLPCLADPAPAIHYATAENLEHIDVVLLDGARKEIDVAAYVFSDWPVIQVLARACGICCSAVSPNCGFIHADHIFGSGWITTRQG